MMTGECFCASIKYQYAGELMKARSCHCSRCRKAFGAAASAYAEVEPEKFEWIKGEDLLTYYASNDEWGKCFCRKCGTTLCGMHHGKVHGITLGCLNGEPQVKLQMHLFVGSKAGWEELPPGNVPQYETFPPP